MSTAAIPVLLIVSAFYVSFEYNFEKMMEHSERVRRTNSRVDQIYERSVVPSVFSVPTREQALAIEDVLKEEHVPKTVDMIISGASIVPDAQIEKQAILKKIDKQIAPLKDRWIKSELNVNAKAVKNWAKAKPFGFEALPVHLQDALRGKSGNDYLMYLYPSVPVNTAWGVHQFANMVRSVERKFPTMLTGCDTVVFAEILDLIRRDGSIILLVIFLSVGFFIWANVKHTGEALCSYLPLILALPIGMGLMAALGIRFNIFNIALIPSFVAMGIDVPIHIVHRAREIRSGHQAARDLATSIHLALVTAGIGFGVLIFSGAGVLRSLGWIALLGTVSIWWVGLVLLPALLEWYFTLRDAPNPKSSRLRRILHRIRFLAAPPRVQ